MMSATSKRLEAIQSMLSRGQRSVHIEQHTLWLWGLTGAFLILTVKLFFVSEYFGDAATHALASNSYITVVLVAIGILDYRLTRRVRRERDETLPFVQQQLFKVWWLILGLVVAVNIGMNFFGGGYLFFGIMLALVGLAFYIQGLFSEQMLSWIGVLLIILGLGSVSLNVPFVVMEWLTVFVFGIGLPLLAWMLKRKHTRVATRTIFALIWLIVVVGPTALLASFQKEGPPTDQRVIGLDDYLAKKELSELPLSIVRLPAGTLVPVQIDLRSDVFGSPSKTNVPIRLKVDLDVVLRYGKPDGFYRVGDEHWKSMQFNFHIRKLERSASITQSGVGAATTIEISLGR